MASKRVRIEQGIWSRTTKSGERRLEIQFRDGTGRVRRQVIEGGIREARTALAVAVLDRRSGDRREREIVPTFAEAAERWLAAESARLRPSTVRVYRAALKHLLPEFGERDLSAIEVDALADYLARKRAEGLKPWTVKSHLTAFRRTFGYAQRRLGFRGQAPATLLERSEIPAIDAAPKRVLTQAEIAALILAAPSPFSVLFALLATSGIRMGEALGLRSGRVDFEAGTVEIAEQLVRGGMHRGGLGRRRPGSAQDARGAQGGPRSGSGGRHAGRPAARGRAGGRPGLHQTDGRATRSSRVARAIRRAVEHGGVVEDQFRPKVTAHTFRHTFASTMIGQDADLVELSRALGHSSPTVTATHYLHQIEARQRVEQRRQRVESAFADALGGVYGMSTPALAEAA